jgi:serine/threonine protein kinase
MKSSSKGEFFRLLRKSRLLSGVQRLEAKDLCQSAPDADACVDLLVQRQFLTEWQAAQLLRGRSRFFLGKYKLLKFRGRGAMGIVFKAEHTDLHRTVAIKILSKTLLNKPRSVTRFLREIRSAAALNHPNLVVAYDADQIDDTYCLIMEYVSGRSLKALCIERGRLPVLWSCECARQAALALAHIHERGLVHRDVKPSNLIVTVLPPENRPQVKLLDIGLARFVSESEEEGSLTRDGQIVGTGDYMAPEQVAKAKQADIRADIYGLGATLYQLLTGAPPLVAGTILQTYINRLQNEPASLSTICSDLPPGLDTVLMKMLKRDPRDRYQTPEQVAADLASVLAGKPPEFATSAAGSTAMPDAAGQGSSAEFQFTLPGSEPGLPFFDPESESNSADPSSADQLADSTISGFFDLLKTGSSDTTTHFSRRRKKAKPTATIGAIGGQASRMIRKLVDGLAALRSGEPEQSPPVEPEPHKTKRAKRKSPGPRPATRRRSTPKK